MANVEMEHRQEVTQDKLADTQCKECKFFHSKSKECGFVLYANLNMAEERFMQWYRDHAPEDIELIEDCNMSPDRMPQNRAEDNIVYFQR